MMQIIDVHHHLYDTENYLDDMVNSLQAKGFTKVILNGLGEKYDQLPNESVAAALRQYPHFIVGLAHLRLDSATPEKVEWYLDQGFAGLKCINPAEPYDSPAYFPLYEAAEKNRMPILFHTGIVACRESDRSDTVISHHQRPVHIDTIARTFQDLPMIIAHLGSPWYDEAFMVARVHQNVFLDLSSGSGWLKKGMDGTYFRTKLWWDGALEKMLFATDVPFTKADEIIKEHLTIFRQMRLSKAERKGIFFNNARRVFKNI